MRRWGAAKTPASGRGTVEEGLLKYTETQTVAVQRILPVGPRRGADAARYARWMTRLLALVRRTRVLG